MEQHSRVERHQVCVVINSQSSPVKCLLLHQYRHQWWYHNFVSTLVGPVAGHRQPSNTGIIGVIMFNNNCTRLVMGTPHHVLRL